MTRVAAPQLRTCRPQLAAVIAWPGRLVESRSQRVRTLVLINGRPRSAPRPIWLHRGTRGPGSGSDLGVAGDVLGRVDMDVAGGQAQAGGGSQDEQQRD